MKNFNLMIILIFLMLGNQWANAKVEVFDRVIAIVDDSAVLQSELNRKVKNFRADLKRRGAKLPNDKVFRKQVLERLIMDHLQLNMARRAGIRVSDAELNATLQKIAKRSHLTLDQFRKKLEAKGENYTLFREDFRQGIMINRIRQARVGRRVFISEQEAQEMMKLIKEQGANNTKYHLGHILVAIPETAAASDIKVARKRAETIVKLLRHGQDFAQTAISSSDGQDALQGGDFGWRSITELPTLFAGVAKRLKIGEISEPLRSASGLHILKLLARKGDQARKMVQQVHSRHILLKVTKIRSEEAARRKLLDLRTQIIKGTDFGAMAKKFSEDLGSASQGGDLKWADPKIFVPKFREALAKLKDGEISQPVRSQFGWHLIQRLGSRIADQTAEGRLENARRLLYRRKFDEEVSNWLRQIRAEAFVKIIDPGKS